MKRVAILASQEIALFELACAVELFALPREDIENWYACDVVSFDNKPKTATGSLHLACKTIRSLKPYTHLVIPNWSISSTRIEPHLASEVRAFAQEGKTLVSFCSGAFLLAQLGLLDGKTATTHWRYAHTFANRFPAVEFKDNVLFVFDGSIGCSAGSAAGIDLGLEIIRHDFGYQTANKVARRMVVSAHRQGGQAQFVDTPVSQFPNRFAETLDWAVLNLGSGVTIETMAKQANMSRRSFDRKFKDIMACSPHIWLTEQKIKHAKTLLEGTEWHIERIAEAAGFETSATLRHHFRKLVGVAPITYRLQFGNTS